MEDQRSRDDEHLGPSGDGADRLEARLTDLLVATIACPGRSECLPESQPLVLAYGTTL